MEIFVSLRKEEAYLQRWKEVWHPDYCQWQTESISHSQDVGDGENHHTESQEDTQKSFLKKEMKSWKFEDEKVGLEFTIT